MCTVWVFYAIEKGGFGVFCVCVGMKKYPLISKQYIVFV